MDLNERKQVKFVLLLGLLSVIIGLDAFFSGKWFVSSLAIESGRRNESTIVMLLLGIVLTYFSLRSLYKKK